MILIVAMFVSKFKNKGETVIQAPIGMFNHRTFLVHSKMAMDANIAIRGPAIWQLSEDALLSEKYHGKIIKMIPNRVFIT